MYKMLHFTVPMTGKFCSWLSLLITLFLAGPVLGEEKILTAHIRHRPPYMIVQGDFLGGSLREILDQAAHRLGYHVQWQDVPFNKSIEDLEAGRVDIVPRTIPTPARKQFMRFLKPIGYEQQEILFLTRKGAEKSIRNYDDLKTLKIATKKGTAYFQRFDVDNELSKVPFAGDDYGLIDLFIKGDVDTLIVLDRRALESALVGLGFTDYGYAQYRLVQQIEINYGFSKKSSNAGLAEALEQEMQEMLARGEVDPILSRNFMGASGSTLATQLTPAERQWLEKHPDPFLVHNPPDRAPFNAIQEQRPYGFAIDTMDLLASKLALPIRYLSGPAGMNGAERLKSGEVDIVLDPLADNDMANLLFTSPYPGSSTGIAVRENMAMLRDLLEKAISRITPEEAKRLLEKWPQIAQPQTVASGSVSASPQGVLQRLGLTSKEIAWLQDHDKIRLGMVKVNPPFTMVQEGKLTGLIPDFIALLAKSTGLTIESIPMESTAAGIQAIKADKIDLLSTFASSDERAESLLVTEPYMTFPLGIVIHRDAAYIGDLADLTNLQVAVVRGEPALPLLAKHYPQLALVPMESIEEALNALNDRRVHALVENLASATYGINQLKLDRLQIAAPTSFQAGPSLTIRSDWPELRSILQKAMGHISIGEKNALRNTWMAIQVQVGIDIKKFIYWGIPIIVLLALIIARIVTWNLRLRREITVRKQTEAALEAMEERSRLLLEAVGDGIFGVDRDGCFIFINPAGLVMLGVDVEQVIGKKFCLLNDHLDLYDSSVCQKDLCSLRQVVEGKNAVHHGEGMFWCRNGDPFHVEYTSQPIIKNGEVLGTVVVFKDISQRLQQEQHIRILSSAVEQSPVSIVITDPQANIEYVNPAFTRVSGYQASEVMGKNPRILKSGQMEEDFYHRLWQTLLQNQTWDGEFLNRKKSGELYWESTTISPILDNHGNVLHYLANKEDITARKLAHEQLQEAMELIAGSIHYASRIQQSILTPPDRLAEALPEHFVLWEPRDVVGGDMYWYRPWFTGTLLLLGDCTGHGVPGAFVTLIVNGALDQALLETPPGDPANLLQRMHQLIQYALGQHIKEGASNDGVELGVCYLEPGQPNLIFAGARFSLFVVNNDTVQEIKGNKSGMGYRGVAWNVEFSNNQIPLCPDWRYYMTSDGLIDQVSGSLRRGFSKQRFIKLLEELRPVAIGEHGHRIKEALIAFQGEESRRDDVSVVGFQGIINN
ncbi:MAG: transporter substrate-binding domain-containing protein [Magnetococcales bacterium]|nr:transporter substrate-binding domain-containing protein [Magnetococcales bacterium]